MVPIANRPFIEYQFAQLKKHGINEVVLSVCYMPDKVKKAVGNGKKYGIKVDYAVEKNPLGTAGAIKNCEKYLDDTTGGVERGRPDRHRPDPWQLFIIIRRCGNHSAS